MDDSKQKLIIKKDLNEVNLQEHTYCQVLEGSKQKDCDTEHVSDNTPDVQASGLLDESSENNTNIKVNKINQDNAGNGQIIYLESKKTERNICRNGKDLSSDVNKEICGSSENVEIKKESDLKNITVNWPPPTHGFAKRKSHKSYMVSWGTQISCDGYAKCLIETCNFISLDLQTMQEHYRSCDGVPNHNFNLCNYCNSWLPSGNELIIHKSRCKNRARSSFKTSHMAKDSDDTEIRQFEIKDENDISCASPYIKKVGRVKRLSTEINTQMSTDEIKYCDECNQEFLSDADYSQHLICKKNTGRRSPIVKRTRDTILLVSNPEQEDIEQHKDSPIVQPGWHIPKGEYVRRRAYTRQHKTAWKSAIDRYKYVKCIFQNCHFLALSVEDMISHYGYCNGDGSFAKFVCHFCGGRVTTKNFLEIHIRRSHPFEQSDEIYPNFKILKEGPSCLSPKRVKIESPGNDQMCFQGVQLQYSGEAPLQVEVTEESINFDSPGNIFLNQSLNEEEVKEFDNVKDNRSCGDAQAWENARESSRDSTNPRNIRYSSVEELNLLKEHNPESFVVDASQSNLQKTQSLTKVRNDRDKGDHIYSKRKIKSKESESKNALAVMKNQNSKHYTGRKNTGDDISHGKGEETTSKREGNIKRPEFRANRTVSTFEIDGKPVKKIIKSFPLLQHTIKRDIHPSYTSLWTESIKINGFARCLVATCNFISLDIFHIENHFKNCKGVPEKGPNLCTFCDSRLPSAVELWIHTSMCKANGEVNPSCSDVSQSSGECKRTVIPILPGGIGDTNEAVEMENQQELYENENKTLEESDSCNSNKDTIEVENILRKEKLSCLRISDIVKLKDHGGLDYNRIIQPGPVLPKGHYIRRRSYTKMHKAVWESALRKHKYVKCIFQNCHFLAMSLEDMIYHFGYCIGDGSFAKYQCPYCGGRLTTKVVLDIHIQISHSDKIADEDDRNMLTENEEVVLPCTLDGWKKLISKKELKTYRKNNPRSIKLAMDAEGTVFTEYSETSQDDYSSNDVVVLEKNETVETVTEVEDKDFDVNKIIYDSRSNKGNSSTRNQTFERNNVKISSREESLSNEKNNENTVYKTGKKKSIDLTGIANKSDASKITPVKVVRTPKIIFNKNKNKNHNHGEGSSSTPGNPNGKEKSCDGDKNVLSSGLGKNSITRKQETENGKKSLPGKAKVENGNSNKNDQKNKNDTKLKIKRGRKPKLLSKESLSDKEKGKEVLGNSDTEGTRYEGNNPEGSEKPDAKLETLQNEINPEETSHPIKRKRGRPPKRDLNSKALEVKEVIEEERKTEVEGKGKRGRKRKSETLTNNDILQNKDASYVKCAKCGFETKRQMFSDHNYKKHVGLSWIEGENPIDLNDESVVSWYIKQAFKYIKSATCENCGDVKKSALGFISHVQNCGKSEEEKDALKVKCPFCPARILKYSLPMHLKLSHGDSDKKKQPKAEAVVEKQLSKRKSALKAVNKFCEVLDEEDEEDDTKKKIQYVLYEKGVSKLPKLPRKIRCLWNKMIKEKKKIPCRRRSCLTESSNIQEARNHHFLCSELPKKCYVCQRCDYYTESKADIQHHMDIHPKIDKDFTLESDEGRSDEEADMKDDDEEHDLTQRRSKIFSGSSDDSALEASYKAKFFARERIQNERHSRFCRHSLRMTLECEMEDVKNHNLTFPELRTKASEWIPVKPENATKHFPSLEESISFNVIYKNNKGNDWKKMKRFTGEIIEDSAMIFTGGSILSMSWCKYSCLRSCKQNTKQLLAVSSTKKMNKFQNIHSERDDTPCLIQIYNFGEMKTFNDVKDVPVFAMGIALNCGVVWELSWFPLDYFEDRDNENFLTRVGLLAAACQDGTIKIWPICDPDELKPVYSLPIYKIQPKVVLKLEDEPDMGCLHLAVGRTGVVVGGFADGIVAAWTLKSISFPFCKSDGKSYFLKPYVSFQAHKTSITALSICQNNDRYITTSGLDRLIKFWDLECPWNPFESMHKEVCFENIWPKQWPLTLSTFENIIPCSGKGMIKAIRDVYCDKHRTPLALDGTCWSISFNEWLNVLCGCNNLGEVKIRFMRNMFVTDDRFQYRKGNTVCDTELKFLKETGKEKEHEKGEVEPSKGANKKNAKETKEKAAVPRTYDEAREYFGLIFHDFDVVDNSKQRNASSRTSKKDEPAIEEYPVASINKVCWNPNYKRFMQLAIGHHCGIVRIKPLNDSKCNDEVLRFLSESEGKMSKMYIQ